MIKCPDCFATVEHGQKFCTKCGKDLAKVSLNESKINESLKCPNCGNSVLPEQKFCSSCGHKLIVPTFTDTNAASRITPRNDVDDKLFSSTDGISVACPECGKMTDSLKLYRLPALWVSLFVYLRYSTKGHVCCPSCMRKKILLHGFTYNIITANIYWPFLILPWSVVNLCRTYSKGHSKEIADMLKTTSSKSI